MIQVLKKISVIGFVIYFLGISIGLTFNLHYCEGEIADVAFFTEEAVCEMSDIDRHSHHSDCPEGSCHIDLNDDFQNGQSTIIHHCCSDKSIFLHIESKPIISFSKISITIPIIELDREVVLHNKHIAELVLDNNYIPLDYLDSYPPPFIIFQQLLVYS